MKSLTWNITIEHEPVMWSPGDPEPKSDDYCITWVLTNKFTGQSLTYGKIEDLEPYEVNDEKTS